VETAGLELHPAGSFAWHLPNKETTDVTSRLIGAAIMVFCVVTFLIVLPIALAMELWAEHHD
jgi:hypothetical protein